MKIKICIVQSIYNEDITEKLSFGANKELKNSGINKVDIVKVPGAFEIPGMIARLVKKYDGFIAIGCVIKGETANFDLICSAITNGIMQISVNEKKPLGTIGSLGLAPIKKLSDNIIISNCDVLIQVNYFNI